MKIRSQAKLRVAWVFAIFWNLVSAPATFLGAVPQIKKGDPIAWFALIFPFIGAALLIWAIHLTLRFRRFGVSWLEVSTDTVALGGPLRARIAARHMPDESPVLLKLSCVNRIVSGSGKDRSVRERVVWQEEQTVAREGLEPGPEGAVVPVSFQLPLDAPPTRSDNSDDRILWRLQARARLAGVDYDEQFEVPVAAAPSGTTPAADPQAVAPAERPESSRIVVEPDPAGGTRFLLPAARNAGAKLVSIFYACLFSGFAALFMILARTQARGILAGFIPWVLGIILVAFALVMVLVALHTCLLSTSVTVSSTGVAVKSRVLGLSWSLQASRREVGGVSLSVGMQVGATPYYDLKIARRAGQPLTIPAMLRDKREAEWLAAEITKALR